MKKLLKEYNLNSDMQYFEMILDSITNGQRNQAINQFKALPKANKKQFVVAINTNWDTQLLNTEKELFINLL